MTSDYSFTRHRIFQWMGILLSLGLVAVGYWYFSARAGIKINSSLTDPLSDGLAGYWKLDEFRFYKRALTATEIAALYNQSR